MKLTLRDTQCLVNDGAHNAFCGMAKWQDGWYIAHRTAASHAITPAGSLRLWKSVDSLAWEPRIVLAMPNMDLRDPRLIASPEALYLICGAYQPKYPSAELRPYSTQNIIQSYITYTEDGERWAPLQPFSRPGYWIWSAIAAKYAWMAAAYHTGRAGETSSIHLLSGTSLLDLKPLAMIYDGSNLAKESGEYCYAHTSPSEPVLYQPQPGSLACCLRTETHIEIGISRAPYQDWRWWMTESLIHPSAMYPVGDTWLMAGRALVEAGVIKRQQQYDTYACLWEVTAQFIATPAHLMLPSAKDTAYAALCEGTAPNELLCVYYSQHLTGSRFGTTMPGAGVFVSRIAIEQ